MPVIGHAFGRKSRLNSVSALMDTNATVSLGTMVPVLARGVNGAPSPDSVTTVPASKQPAGDVHAHHHGGVSESTSMSAHAFAQMYTVVAGGIRRVTTNAASPGLAGAVMRSYARNATGISCPGVSRIVSASSTASTADGRLASAAVDAQPALHLSSVHASGHAAGTLQLDSAGSPMLPVKYTALWKGLRSATNVAVHGSTHGGGKMGFSITSPGCVRRPMAHTGATGSHEPFALVVKNT